MNFSFGSTTPKTTASASTTAGTGTTSTLGMGSGGLFGSSASTTGLQFGGAGDSSKLGVSTPTAAVKPTATATPLSFTPTTTAVPGFTGFGVTPLTTTTAAAAATAQTQAAAAPTFSFGAAATTTAAAVAQAQTQASAAPSFSFGAATTTTPAAPTSAPLSFSLTPATTTAKPTTTATLSLGGSVTTAASAATTLSSAASGATATTGNITFVQLEETINKWTHELEEQEKVFMSQAVQINNWDNLLNSNSEKIVALNNEVHQMKLQQQQLDHELDFILAQQRELEEVLAPLEKQTSEVPSNTDPEREHTYYMAETLDTQLKQMSEDLREIIEHLNESSRTQDTTDPIVQIGRILNAHMNSLHWIDQMTMNIQNQLENVTRLHDAHRRENERSFRSSYEY